MTMTPVWQDVLHERVKLHRAWKDTEALLSRKRDERTKFEQQQKTDRLAAITQEISEVETRIWLVKSSLCCFFASDDNVYIV